MRTIYDYEKHITNLKSTLSKLIDYVEQASKETEIHQAERKIFALVVEMGLHALKLFIAHCGTGYTTDSAPVSDKGHSLRYKGLFSACYLSIFGELKIPRAGYHDARKNRYVYPLDARLNLPEDKYSYLLVNWLLSRATETDYRESVDLFETIFGLNLGQSIPQRQCEKVSPSVDAFYEQAFAPPPESEGSHLVFTGDSKGIRIHKSERDVDAYKPETPKARRAKGEKPGIKKEAVVTAAYSFNPGPRTAEDIVKALLKEYTPDEVKKARAEKRKARQEQEALPRLALNKYQRATLEGKDKAFDSLMRHIIKRDPQGDKKIIGLIDGAPSLEFAAWRAIKKYGLEARVEAIILDIIHVCEYVWEAGTAIHGEKSGARLPWVRKKMLDILNGKVGYVIGGLKQVIRKGKLSASKAKTLQKVITYFSNHKHMMKYHHYLQKGFPIGTGVVEAACGALVKNRMEGSGMRWKIKGAQAMLEQRAVKLNGDWKPFMKTFIENEHHRLYADDAPCFNKKAA